MINQQDKPLVEKVHDVKGKLEKGVEKGLEKIRKEWPAVVTIGKKREGLDKFDDLPTLEKHAGPYRIQRIKVQFNKENILGLRLTYLSSDGQTVEGHDITKFKPFGQLFGNVHEETFEIQKDDDLLEICGKAGDRINEIGFRTYRGQTKTYGLPQGEAFSYKYRGATFGAASGGYGEHLDFLELRVCALPVDRDAQYVKK